LFKTTGLPSSSDSDSDSENEHDQIGDGGEDPSVSFEINNSYFVDEEDPKDNSVVEVSHQVKTPSKPTKSASKKKSSSKLPPRSKASNTVANKKRKQGQNNSCQEITIL
jgi:nucleosome binding factor SPN SPT16 subunit